MALLFVAGLSRTRSWTDVTTLFLVVEVISPSTERTGRTRKRPAYQAYGIPQCWIIDAEQRHVEVWAPDGQTPAIVRDQMVWRHPLLSDECVIDLVKLFDFG